MRSGRGETEVPFTVKRGRGGSLEWRGPTSGKDKLLLQLMLLCSLFKCFVSKVIFVFWVFFAVSLAIAVATLFGTRSV